MPFHPQSPLSVHVRSMCALCTQHLRLEATQQMRSVTGRFATSSRKVNVCHLHLTVSICTSSKQIISPSCGRGHCMPSEYCQSQMGMAGRLQMMVLSPHLSQWTQLLQDFWNWPHAIASVRGEHASESTFTPANVMICHSRMPASAWEMKPAKIHV